MIGMALKLLRDELSDYVFRNKRPGDSITQDDIILHNIAMLESDTSGDLNNKIVITLVNTEEESTLKNRSNTVRILNGIKYVEPSVFLNLYILITATLGEDLQDAYEFALNRLSIIIQFFQAKKSFTIKNSPFNTISNDANIPQEIKDELRLNMELYTLTFEQINHLWGSLGGKQVPFAMYKVRLVKIQENTGEEAPIIEEIKNTALVTNAECDE
jgi:uncharacterized protein DUF4255